MESIRTLLALVCGLMLPLTGCGGTPDRSPSVSSERSGPPHVVFVTGDEEYRSEESMPMLARILARDHGYRVTVCYALSEEGTIDPNRLDHIEGLEALDDADLLVLFTRFRALPDDELRRILAYADSGRPLVGFRTATHPFRYPDDDPRAADLNHEWPRRVFGQGWVTHHGHFGDNERRLTRVTIRPDAVHHPILRGVEAFEAYSWLYHVEGDGDRLAGENLRLLDGRSLESGHEKAGRLDRFPIVNPVAWTRTHTGASGIPARIFFTTLGHPYDFREPSMRRLALQGILWASGEEARIPVGGVDATEVGTYDPPPSGFGTVFRAGVRPLPIEGAGP